MIGFYILTGLCAIGLIGYLLIALLYAEEF